MVSIVIVSHSRLLAQGVKELAVQMTQGKVSIAATGGIDDEENPIGTDPMAVMAAIESVAGEDGVLVLMDLGSALMSAETALDFMDETVKERVRLCAAPLVEGALAAAVQASIGASLDEVEAEALTALAVKEAQLAPVTGGAPQVTPDSGPAMPTEGVEARFVIANPMGLHARPAAALVTCAGGFDSRITLGRDGRWVSARSINQVATLAVACGEEVTLRAEGADAREAIEALTALHAVHFNETITASGGVKGQGNGPVNTGGPSVGSAPLGVVQGIGSSTGVSAGPAHLFLPSLPEIVNRHGGDTAVEEKRLMEALAHAVAELEELGRAQGAGTESAIFDVHRLILQDPELRDDTLARLGKDGLSAEAAWQDALLDLAKTYEGLSDTYMKERAADVMDAGGRVLRSLLGEVAPSLDLETPSVVIAHDLMPSDVAGLDPRRVLALVCEVGGKTSHAAIIARGLGIPAVVGAAGMMARVAEGDTLVVDGDAGTVELAPDSGRVAEVIRLRGVALGEQAAARKGAKAPAVSLDGVRVHVVANIGLPTDAPSALDNGAEGVGLFRTEFLFQARAEAPSEEDQVAAYTEAARAMDGHPVIIRTLDVGGDKPLPYIVVAEEENPFLGQRGVRLCLERPELFKPQLRALLRASAEANIKVMVPMVSHLEELRAVRALMETSAKELEAEGFAKIPLPPLGIMIEVPAAVALADQLATEADFFSIGTNDLTQYVMAADRGNPGVAGLSDNLHPAVLRMVKQTVDAAATAGIPVGMCGELAGRLEATPLLLGLGLDELSLSAPGIPGVKAALRGLSKATCRGIAEEALTLTSGREVEALLKRLGDTAV